MWERTVTISSAGKTFSATGWKVYMLARSNDYERLASESFHEKFLVMLF
jgi:aspartate/methionine/tyrosine aminotransferase